MRLLLVLLFSALGMGNIIFANNVQVSNIEVFSIDRTNKIIYIQFDLSGENAWRTTGGAQNWDADWVFVKYRTGTGNWQHATLSTNGAIYVSPAEAQIDQVNDGKGVFIYASSANVGNIASYNYQHIVLAWEYGTDNFDETNTTDLEVRVFAIEMVYIPQGSFYIGSGGSETNAFYTYNTGTPYFINSEDAISIGRTSGQLYYENSNTYGGDQQGMLSTSFPKGYNAFYIMKYEISQQQYVDFLNNLTNAEANARDNVTNSARNNVSLGSDYPNITTSSPYVAMNWLDWFDVAAYLDWAALRPMTELEFEKAARGTGIPVANGNPWGDITKTNTTYTLLNANAVNENVSNPSTSSGNINWQDTSPNNPNNGPMRCGVFATNNTSNSRQFAGASYYGVMDLGGNLWEPVVTIGNPEGRLFDGTNGNGQLVNAEADNNNWPNDKTNDKDLGVGFKGGSYRNANFQISDRIYAAYGYFRQDDNQGGRGVRIVD